ncbi:Zn-dependent protease with chaperone function [Persephonella hydrogeniphila]|uniref:Zn-dependent protease with chaperone function n=1 Tax=Persephonella hydrogeniphila TaxID=198703 RepID=A0A285NJK2_9AQUI|nr:M48 family metalloprotease [Persephonella hydrogeniphila]SNZ08046.1 Zn-dependent protease with chaperone function [Persephonella hydrogeniphila]
MRKKSNVLFFLISLFFFSYIFLYIFMFEQLSIWINDINSCYSVMGLLSFFVNHIHIFVYLSAFLIMSYGLTKMIFAIFKAVKDIFFLNRDLNKLKKRSFKKLLIVDSDIPLSFAFFNRIVLSDSIIKNLNKKEKKAIFYHELAHLKNYDSIKFLLGDILLSVLPESIKKIIKHQLIVFSEFYADRSALEKVPEKELFNAVLKLKEIKNNYPQGASFIEERLNYLFEDENIEINKAVFVIQMIPLVLFIITFIYRTCFCGVM